MSRRVAQAALALGIIIGPMFGPPRSGAVPTDNPCHPHAQHPDEDHGDHPRPDTRAKDKCKPCPPVCTTTTSTTTTSVPHVDPPPTIPPSPPPVPTESTPTFTG